MLNLSMENITYRYRNAERPAINQVSCIFEPGKIYAIAGPSGSGKSTLLSLLAGLDLPSEGDIRFMGNSLKTMDLDRYRRENISMIFQAYQLFPLLSAIENVCYPMELNGMDPKDAKPRAEKFLASVGITPEQMKRFPSNLSGGEQQRTAIARSLASGAKILLADEPTGNLDAVNSENIMKILCKLAHEDGFCIIIVTHDMDIANVADVTYKMVDGVISIDGS